VYDDEDKKNLPLSPTTRCLAALLDRKLIPAGAAYLEHVRRAVKKLSFDEYDAHLLEEEKRLAALSGADAGVEDDLGVGDEEESPDLLLLDPKEWKVRLSLSLVHMPIGT
jgi:DnaJ homolog subfamily C member 2